MTGWPSWMKAAVLKIAGAKYLRRFESYSRRHEHYQSVRHKSSGQRKTAFSVFNNAIQCGSDHTDYQSCLLEAELVSAAFSLKK